MPPPHLDAYLHRSESRGHPQPSERNLFSVTAAVADVPAMCSTSFSSNQGLTLVHLSAQRQRFLWDRGCV